MGSKISFPSDLPATEITTCFQTNPAEKVWNGPFTFIQAADTQFGLISSSVLKSATPGWEEEVELTQEIIRKVNKIKPKPRFIVICGDMLDAYPDEGESVKTREKQYVDFVKVFRELDPEIKLICVCGNHDIGSQPTTDSLQIYRRQFGPEFFSFWVGGVKFVVLSSQYFETPGVLPEETERQEKFMQTISDSAAKHIVVFQHIPYFVDNPDEDLIPAMNIDKPVRIKLLSQLKKAGVRYIFCGHYHRNAGGTFDGMEQVVTSAVGAQMGNDKSGYRIVRVLENNITHKYVNLSKNYKLP